MTPFSYSGCVSSILTRCSLIFDNLVEPTISVHGVVVTHLLAKEELRVRFSLDALRFQEWTPPCHGGDHRFKSGMGRFVRFQTPGLSLQVSTED